MNLPRYFAGKTPASVLFFTIIFHLDASAQAVSDSLSQNIETVRITKFLPKNSENLGVGGSQLLSHDAGRFLGSVPEISGIKKAGSYATDPVLRGFKFEQLNIVIDGAANAVNACPSRMDPAVSQVNMNMVQQAEIYKGPYFFRYGSALGGTVNFATPQPTFTEIFKAGGRISTGHESNGNISRNELFASLSNKRTVWDVFGSYQRGERYRDGNGEEVPSAFLRYNIGTKGTFKWNEGNVTTLQANTNQARNVEFAALKMNLLYDKTWMIQLKHLAEFKNSFIRQLEASSYLADVNHSMGTPDMAMVSNVKTRTYGARGELKTRFGKNIFYTGLDFKHEAAENIGSVMPMMGGMVMKRDGTSWQNSEIARVGWFNEYLHFFKDGKFTASYRLDYNEGDARDLSKLFISLYGTGKSKTIGNSLSMGYTKFLHEHSQLSLWLGRAQRGGSLTELYINRFPVGTDAYEVVGNPQLKPETNNQADIIYTFKNDKLCIQADGFYSYMQNYFQAVINKSIMPSSMAVPGVRRMENLDGAMKAGGELRMSWQFLRKFRSEMAAAYTYAEDLKSRTPLPEIAPLDFRWKLIADLSPVTASLAYRYAAPQHRYSSSFGETATPDFSVFGVAADYKIFKNAVLDFEVDNIFDRAYAEYLSRTLAADPRHRIFERGRSFNVSFSYYF